MPVLARFLRMTFEISVRFRRNDFSKFERSPGGYRSPFLHAMGKGGWGDRGWLLSLVNHAKDHRAAFRLVIQHAADVLLQPFAPFPILTIAAQ